MEGEGVIPLSLTYTPLPVTNPSLWIVLSQAEEEAAMNDSQPAAGESNVRGDNKEIREDSIEDND